MFGRCCHYPSGYQNKTLTNMKEKEHFRFEDLADTSPTILRRGNCWWGGTWLETKCPVSVEDTLQDDWSALELAEHLLRQHGVDPRHVPAGPVRAVLVAEAVNWAAKIIDGGFYDLKPAVCDEVAAMAGVVSGWGDDDCFYLCADGAGAASFHDPFGQIKSRGEWPFPWSGVLRQAHAFDLLRDENLRKRVDFLTNPRWRAAVEKHRPHLSGPVGPLP